MCQIIDMYVSSTGEIAARLFDGQIRPLSNCESNAILQNAPQPVSRCESVSFSAPVRRHVVRITATRQRTVTVSPVKVAA